MKCSFVKILSFYGLTTYYSKDIFWFSLLVPKECSAAQWGHKSCLTNKSTQKRVKLIFEELFFQLTYSSSVACKSYSSWKKCHQSFFCRPFLLIFLWEQFFKSSNIINFTFYLDSSWPYIFALFGRMLHKNSSMSGTEWN